VQAHAWAPVRHGKPVRAQRIVFFANEVTTKRCHVALGTYSLHIDHRFSFEPVAGRIKAGCPGRTMQKALQHATGATVETHGDAQRLVFTNQHDHVVATLQG
jgi:hypothetical protein